MSVIDLELEDDGYWIWDNNFDGITFISLTGESRNSQSLQNVKTKAVPVFASLYNDIRLSFIDIPSAHELLKFRRHIQRHVNPQNPVTLRDVKDVVIFQVKQKLSSFFLDFFHTPEVDRFLRCLVLYFLHYTHVWAWMSLRAVLHADKIRIPGLRPRELHERQNLAALRLLVASAYSEILLGYGGTRRFHHTYRTQTSWTQRDVRMWEWLIRLSTRIIWVVFYKRHPLLIKSEMDRLFRSDHYLLDDRKSSPLFAAVLQSLAGSREAALAPKAIGDECPPDHSAPESPFGILSPLSRELKFGDYNWKLAGIGRVNLEDDDEELVELLELLRRTEDYLVANGQAIGVLGMAHADVDSMLTVTAKKPQESRTLTDILADVREFFSRVAEEHADWNMCLKEFPMGTLDAGGTSAEELEEARDVWRKNYYKVKGWTR